MAKRMQRLSSKSLQTSDMSGDNCCGDGATFDHWGPFPGTTPYDLNTSKPYTDPKQGCINDCWFIAALVSIALSANSKLKIHPKYKFYDVENGQWSAEFSINDNLPLTLDNKLVYARSSRPYTWPCLYEKAYAVWKMGSQTPAYDCLNGGRGDNGLLTIVGGVLGPNRTMPTFTNNIPSKPVVATKTSGSTSHDYSVVKKVTVDDQPGYQLRDPCGGGFISIKKTDFESTFTNWRYVTPA